MALSRTNAALTQPGVALADGCRIAAEPHGGASWREMVALREAVLRLPLGLRFGAAELAAEVGQIHLALWQAERLAGTLLLLLPPDPDGLATLRQMAIRPELAGRGLGTMLVRHAEALLRGLGAVEATLAARETTMGFYARLGYAGTGAVFLSVGLPHRTMRRRLDAGGKVAD